MRPVLNGCVAILAGNAFLPAFIDDYNGRFAKATLEDRDVHRPLSGHDDLDPDLCAKILELNPKSPPCDDVR